MQPDRTSTDHVDDLPRLSELICSTTTLTGAELADLVARVTGGLHRLGVTAGDHVALLMRNSLELVAAEKALRWLGACAVPVNWHASADEISYIIQDCGTSVLIAHDDLVPESIGRVEDLVAVPSRRGPTGSLAELVAGSFLHWHELTRSPGRGPSAGGVPLESVIYTSGTTGRPKGVVRAPATEVQRRAGLAMRETLYGLHAGARLLVTAPLYHAAPLQFAHHVVDVGELVVVAERFDPESFLQDIERHRITHTFAVPTMFSRLLGLDESVRRRYDTSSLEFVLHAGAPCPPTIKERMIAEWGLILFEYYGSTELGPVTFCSSSEWLDHPGTVGRPLPGVELSFVDATGRPGARQPAEIAVHHEAYPDFTYLGGNEARAELQRGEYVATGDVGFLDPDGYLHVSDRVRDMIISGGVNIYPAEIEAVIQELPGVQDCAVFAVSDDDLGEAVATIVQPISEGSVSVDTVRRHVESKLGRLKHPRLIELQANLPRAENGKLKKRELRAQFERRQSGRAGLDTTA